jgi:PAS domain S-box-containing protein
MAISSDVNAVDEASLRALLDNIPVGIGVAEPVEADGSVRPEARIVYYNKQWVRMFGFSEKDVKTADEATRRLYPDPVFRAEMFRKRSEATKRRRNTEDGEQMEIRAMGAEGQWRDVVTGTAVLGNRMIVTMHDITEQKQAEEALAAALKAEQSAREAAERATRAKSLFLASMSHEIRTPLSAMISLAQAMWMECGKQQLSPEFTEFLDRVRSGGNYLNLILGNLLDVSAAESGHLPVRADAFYLLDWVDDMRNILEPLALPYRVNLVWRLPEDTEVRLLTDQQRLAQILLNLVHNAIKFSGSEGRTVTVSLIAAQDELEISVSDEGPGLPPERLPELFNEFAQNQTPSPVYAQGVGLGLSVVKQNTELLGGRIRAENLTPHGMCFTIRLPLRRETSNPAPLCVP